MSRDRLSVDVNHASSQDKLNTYCKSVLLVIVPENASEWAYVIRATAVCWSREEEDESTPKQPDLADPENLVWLSRYI